MQMHMYTCKHMHSEVRKTISCCSSEAFYLSWETVSLWISPADPQAPGNCCCHWDYGCAHWAWLVCGFWGHKLGLLCRCITGWIHSPAPHFCAVRCSSLFSHGPGDFSSPVFLLVSLWQFPSIWIWVVRKILKKCLDIWIIILHRRLRLRNPLFFWLFGLCYESPLF